jgi:enoyl-CoA hydratase/carnithine racemase
LPPIIYSRDENIVILTFNQPDKLNTVDTVLRDLLYEYIMNIKEDATVDGVVLTGNGRGFCAGADLTEFGSYPSIIAKRKIRLQHDIWEELRTLHKPVAVALHGFAIGSGIEMAMICDFRFAAPNTKMALPEATLGTLAAAGGTQSLPRLVKQGIALSFALNGSTVLPEEALKKGLITGIFPQETLVMDTVAFMKNVTKHAKIASSIKQLISCYADQPLEDRLKAEERLVARIWQERLKVER